MINIPETDKKRILIVGCGFAGLTLARKLKNSDYQVAIQQAKLLSVNLKRILKNQTPAEFRYRDLGTMATIGKNLAVVELPYIKFQGLFGWYVWMFIHLMSIVGVKNKLVIFLNWAWKYFTYDQSTRLILRPKGYSEDMKPS